MAVAENRRAQAVAAGALAAGAVAAAGKAVASRLGETSDDDHSGEPLREYRLDRGEDPRDGIRRIAAERADDALEQLRGDGAAPTAEAVHEARKDLKKLRAVLRLVRDDLGDELYRRENGRFRDAGRLLASARDAEVKLETLAALSEHFGDEFPKHELRPLEEALASERAAATAEIERGEEEGPRHRAALEIEAGRATIDEWPLDTDGWGLLAPGVRRSYRRGRRRLAEVRRDPGAENVHEWRKRVKDLWYQLRILRNAWPELLGETAAQAHALAELLGDHHDLAVLAEDAGERDGLLSGEDLERLRGMVARRQDELFGEALLLGARLYAERPKRFATRLAAYWAEWRTGS